MFHSVLSKRALTPQALKQFCAMDLSHGTENRALVILVDDSDKESLSDHVKCDLAQYSLEDFSAEVIKLLSLDDKIGRIDIVKESRVLPLITCKLPNSLVTHDAHEVLRKLYKKLKNDTVTHAIFYVSGMFDDELITQIIKRFDLENYRFDRYKTTGIKSLDLTQTSKKPETFTPIDWKLYLDEDIDAEGLTKRARMLSAATLIARDLVNEPSNILTPTELSKRAESLAEKHGFNIEVYGKDWIVEQGLHAYWSVAKGSDEEPKFIVMKYMNAPQNSEVLGLIGKGMCYDSGGYAIKPASSMAEMHTDMGGSAAVIGAISALASLKAPVNVVAVVAACENMISGHSYKNGDIIASYSGKYIEVGNTDAEGRLTLADALTWTYKNEGATKLVDIATLTGAAIVALGYHYTAVITDTPGMWNSLSAASKLCGDKVWQLPCDEAYAEQNRSDVADIKNIGTGGPGGAGTITAGMFVRAFAGGLPFMHLDIAATSWLKSDGAFYPQGASGVGAELLALYALEEFREITSSSSSSIN